MDQGINHLSPKEDGAQKLRTKKMVILKLNYDKCAH